MILGTQEPSLGRPDGPSAHGLCPRDLFHVSYSLNSLKGCYIGDYTGDYYRGY